MKKKTFMVEQVHLDTLTAAALAIGFIACSDEDDNHDVHSNNLSPPQWRLNGSRWVLRTELQELNTSFRNQKNRTLTAKWKLPTKRGAFFVPSPMGLRLNKKRQPHLKSSQNRSASTWAPTGKTVRETCGKPPKGIRFLQKDGTMCRFVGYLPYLCKRL